MKRRDFTKAIAVSASAWPFAARAQQTAMKHIGAHIASSMACAQLVEAGMTAQDGASGFENDVAYA